MIQVLWRRDNLQNTDQTDPIANTNSSGEAHPSITRLSEQHRHSKSIQAVPRRWFVRSLPLFGFRYGLGP